MIVQSLRHAGWPALFACASAVACSKTAATADVFVNADIGGAASCPVSSATVLMVGGMTSGAQPMTVPEGTNNVSVTCTVSPSGDGFQIQLDAKQPGSSGGELEISGHIDGSTGGKVAAQFVSQMAGVTFAQDDCTLSYTYIGTQIPASQRISGGNIWAHVSCPNAMEPGGSVSGTQTTGPDGGVINSVCDAEADILFSNCSQ
jgi:hypothetical protein